ncbi:helix-turn-helix domain-containing protein [Herbaspirillum sp. RU 5E]|jgi:transcriptional regulator with XRE-family HTH domain|nr:helix-turn-helix domain-containing protein [Herbaspirillum sp. RU 5E]
MRMTEIGLSLRERRTAMGLTQDQLARLAGLSRTTVNQLENGTLADLGYTKLSHLLSLLGLDLAMTCAKGLDQPLEIAARSISTSYRKRISPAKLLKMLETGEAPEQYLPHLITFLDETPLPLVLRTIEDAASHSTTTTPKQMMQHMAIWADQLQVHREVWR